MLLSAPMTAPHPTPPSRWRPLAAALTVLAASPGSAHAEETGSKGRVTAVQINTSGSDQHASVHGSIRLRQSDGKSQDYLWGGSTCPGQKLEPSHVALLVSAHVNRARTWLTPSYAPSEGGDKRCLVAFSLSA